MVLMFRAVVYYTIIPRRFRVPTNVEDLSFPSRSLPTTLSFSDLDPHHGSVFPKLFCTLGQWHHHSMSLSLPRMLQDVIRIQVLICCPHTSFETLRSLHVDLINFIAMGNMTHCVKETLDVRSLNLLLKKFCGLYPRFVLQEKGNFV